MHFFLNGKKTYLFTYLLTYLLNLLTYLLIFLLKKSAKEISCMLFIISGKESKICLYIIAYLTLYNHGKLSMQPGLFIPM